MLFSVLSQEIANYEGGLELKSHMKGQARKKTTLPLKLKMKVMKDRQIKSTVCCQCFILKYNFS